MVEATTHNRLSHYFPTTGVLSNSCTLQLKVLMLFASFIVQTSIPNGCSYNTVQSPVLAVSSKNVEYTMHFDNVFTIHNFKNFHY